MSKLKLVTLTLRVVMAITILVTSSVSIFAGLGNVWYCVFCLALLNIVDLSEKEI